MGVARRLTLASALWSQEFRAKPIIEKIAVGKGAKAALLAYDCLNVTTQVEG